MNSRQLEKLGVPTECRKSAIIAIQNAASAGILRSLNVAQVIRDILANPADHVHDPNFGPFAQTVLESEAPAAPREPIAYRTWGESGIDAESHVQMRQACALPMATGCRAHARRPRRLRIARSVACWRSRVPSCRMPWVSTLLAA